MRTDSPKLIWPISLTQIEDTVSARLMPFFNVDDYGASTRTGERFLYDGHTSSNREKIAARSSL
jgi:hypothetical protein